MARSVVTDILQVMPFWLFDTGPFTPLALPILTPLFGFSTITAPEIITEYQEISEANWIFKKKILKKGDVSNITMTRGVTFYDSDFWRWIMAALTGDMTGIKFNIGIAPTGMPIGGYTPRRMLMLVQFFTRSPVNPGAVGTAALEAGLFATGAALTGASMLSVLSVGTLEFGAAALLSAFGVGPFEFAARIPARAWLLHNCMPARYKPSGDFDAMSSALSIAELEMAVEMVEEISLAA
jgi:hypothetical protein